MFNYFFFISLIIINFLLFFIFIKIAKKLGFIDKSEKFNNPVTFTSAGIIFFFNLITLSLYSYYLQDSVFTNLPNNIIFTFSALTILFLISTVDDVKPIDPKIRLFIQLICVYISLTSVEIYYLDLPLKISILLCLIIWIYILNITNFTDGSDGFLAVNTIFVFINIIILSEIFGFNLFSKNIALILLPSVIVFLYFNKPNAKIYMGDSGSILIGFINGFIFLEMLTGYHLNIALSLLIYPLLDCTIALIRKTFEKKMPWIDTSNYSFLQPTIKKNENKFFVFYYNIFFNLINSILIFLQVLFGWYYIFLNLILAIISIIIFEKKKN
tara:strand:+ start:1135 stop:2115 length:981 start_codon:yes stop_codon:yes gene_type:complete